MKLQGYRAGWFYDVAVVQFDGTFAADVPVIKSRAVGAAQVLNVERAVVDFDLEVSSGDEAQVIQTQRPGQFSPAYHLRGIINIDIGTVG